MQRERLTTGMAAALADLAARGASPGEVAAAAADMWRSIYADLSKVIGSRGMYALYQRSLHLTCVPFPWLCTVRDADAHAGEFDPLREALSQHSSTTALAANSTLLDNFRNLLSNLIGGSLTERLLSAVLENTSSGPDVTGT